MTDEKKFVFVSVAQYGWECHYATEGNCSGKVQGYGEPDYSRAENGALVLDTRPAKSHPNFVSNVYGSPLVDVALKDDQVDECPEPSEMLVAGIADSVFGELLKRHLDTPADAQYGSLDSVSPKAYCAWWNQRGARVGIVQDGKVRWGE